MKYLIFSDIHLHTWQSDMSDELRIPSRLLEQKNVLQQVIDIAIQNNATILFGGDFVHAVGKVPVEVLNVLYWFFQECKKCDVPIYSAVGNHDLSIRQNTSKYHSVLTPFQNLEDRNIALESMNIKFVDYDDNDYEKVKDYDIVILHKQPALVNQHHHKMEGVNWKALESNNRLLFYGHDHTLRILSDKSRVIGCPMHLNMNDAGQDRGCWIVDTESYSVEFIKLQYTELKVHVKEDEKVTEVFEAQIKSISFKDILVEWLERQEKPKEYLALIQKDITDVFQVVKPFFTGKIKTLTVENFLSIEKLSVDFTHCLNLVVGKNGSGKSSIFEAIMWVLFDETTKTLAKSDVIRNRPTKQKDCSGELVLDAGSGVSEEPLIIKRGFKDGLEVYQGDVCLTLGMGKAQAQLFLEKNILGFDKTVYLASCYFSQEKLTLLSQLGDSETTNMVTNLLGFETYDLLYVQMDLKVKECDVKLSISEGNKTKYTNDVWKNEEQQKNLNEQIKCSLDIQSSLKNDLINLEKQIEDVKLSICNIIVPIVTVKDLEDLLLSLTTTKTQSLAKQTDIQLNVSNLTKEQISIEKLEFQYNLNLKNTENEVNRYKNEIEKLKNKTQDTNCKSCGTLLTPESINTCKENIESLIHEQENNIKLVIYPVPENYKEQLDETYSKEADLITGLNDLNIIVENLNIQIKETQAKKETTLASSVQANTRKEELTRTLIDLQTRESRIKPQLQQLNIVGKLEQLEVLKSDSVAVLVSLQNIERDNKDVSDNKAIYEFWKSSFSNKGIRPLLLDKFCYNFNQIIKPLCKDVSGGKFNIEFTPTATTRGGQERNKLGLNIIYKDKTVLYEGLSGGEKTRVNIPLCFGLNKFISSQYNVPNGLLGIIVLDEIFANLDSDGEEDIASFLYNESKNKYIGVITHSDELKSYSNNVWQVKKLNEITTIETIQ